MFDPWSLLFLHLFHTSNRWADNWPAEARVVSFWDSVPSTPELAKSKL